MVGLESLVDFLSLTMWSGSVAGERPVSVILVAPPGAGKTSLLEKFQGETAIFVSDLTARELSTILKDAPKATHILLGDMLSLFGHKSSVVRLTCRMLSGLTGESLKTDSFTGGASNRQLGLITAIPPDDLAKRSVQSQLTAGGFASRFVVLRYSYAPNTVRKIHDYIRADRYTKERIQPFVIDPEPVPIAINSTISRSIQDLAMALKQQDSLGTRIHLQLRTLVKAHARRRRAEIVEKQDFSALESHSAFFKLDGRIL
jgi:hypothetical protein